RAEGVRARIRDPDGPHGDRAPRAPWRARAGLPRPAVVDDEDLARRGVPRRVLDRARLRPVLLGGPPLRPEPRGDGDLSHAGRDARARVRRPRRTSPAITAGRGDRDRDRCSSRRAPRSCAVTPNAGGSLTERRGQGRAGAAGSGTTRDGMRDGGVSGFTSRSGAGAKVWTGAGVAAGAPTGADAGISEAGRWLSITAPMTSPPIVQAT